MMSSVIYIAVTQLVINIIKNVVYRTMDALFGKPKNKQYQSREYQQIN